MGIITIMTDAPGATALYRLMAWLSPAYPVGAFSYSSGIEWAVETADIKDAATLKRWLATVIGDGGGFCDAVFFVHAHRAVKANDDTALREVAELAAAFAPSKERHLETTAQGRAFVEATRAAWPCAALDRLAAVWDGSFLWARPTGSACSRHSSQSSPQPRRALSRRRSIRPGARHSAPISPACTTRPSTRGCSVRDMRRA